MKKQWTLTILAAIVVGVSLPSSYVAQNVSRSSTASRTAQESQLSSVEQFKEDFQNNPGKIRLVALLSPT